MTARSGFTPQQIAEFHAFQARKPAMIRELSDTMGLWQWCTRKECQRGHGCTGSDSACIRAFFAAIPAEDKALFQRAVSHRRNGASADEAWEMAEKSMARDEAPLLPSGEKVARRSRVG